MKNKLFVALGMLLLVAVSSRADGQLSQIPFADPYILVEDGRYYAYGTNDANGIRCYSSTDLRQWTLEGLALNKINTTESRWFWAPEVYRVKDKYYMYYSANEHLYVASSSSPKGPFVQIGGYQMQNVLGSEKCIDSHVFFDTDGKAYIFFVRFTDGNCIWQAQLSDDYVNPIPNTLKKCFAVSEPWENLLGRVTEGPFVIKRNRTYYLSYSANDFHSQDYAVGYATTRSISTGVWEKFSQNPIVRRVDGLVGTGHHSFFTDLEGKLRIVFHAHHSATEVNPRRMYIGTMQYLGSRLVMADEPIIRPVVNDAAKNPLGINPELIDPSRGFENGGAVTADFDNDGFQDFLTAGISKSPTGDSEVLETPVTQLSLFKSLRRSWSNVSSLPFQVSASPTLITADFNGDGNLDVVALDTTSLTTQKGLFLGLGNGNFTEASVRCFTPEGEATDFSLQEATAAQIIDIDNDGLTDLILAGHRGEDRNYCVVLHNLGIFDGDLHFQVWPYAPSLLLSDVIIRTGDFNLDGFTDFIVSARWDNGGEGQTAFTDVFLNSAEYPGLFTAQHLGDKGGAIKRKSNGFVEVADFDGDGRPDFVLGGEGDIESGERGGRMRLYLNSSDAEGLSFKQKFCDFTQTTLLPLSTTDQAAGLTDWDNDGWPDIVVGGVSSQTSSYVTGYLFQNDARGRLMRKGLLPGAKGASITFPDWDGNGQPDLYITGIFNELNRAMLDADHQGQQAIMSYNLNPVAPRPSEPFGCKAELQPDGTVLLSWQAPADLSAPVTYDVALTSPEGLQLGGGFALKDDKNEGVRKARVAGNAGSLLHYRFRPTVAGTYTWTVQTVDAAFAGSVFAQGEPFTVTEDQLPSAISVPQADAYAPAEHFSLHGFRVAPSTPGIHLIRQAGKVRKVLVR